MNRLTCHFRLDPKTDSEGKVTVSARNVACGLVAVFMGLLLAGIFIIRGYDPYEEPLPFTTLQSDVNREEVRFTESDTASERSLSHGSRDNPSRWGWKRFTLLFMNHGFIAGGILLSVAGIRILCTGTRIVVDTRRSRVHWIQVGFYRGRSARYALSEVRLVLHETVVRMPNGFGWRGFAAALVNRDNGSVQLARMKRLEDLKHYADYWRRLTGIPVRETAAEYLS